MVQRRNFATGTNGQIYSGDVKCSQCRAPGNLSRRSTASSRKFALLCQLRGSGRLLRLKRRNARKGSPLQLPGPLGFLAALPGRKVNQQPAEELHDGPPRNGGPTRHEMPPSLRPLKA